MSLLQLWKAGGEDFQAKQIQQLTAIAGDGTLNDGNATSIELRELFSAVPTEQLGVYLRNCLEKSFSDSGLVLQDIVNELGQRLDCDVEHGLYQGKVNSIGFDGIWKFPNGYSIVVEVKTTDAYAISLDKIAGYRKSLIANGTISENSSILIVVGRKDTGSLEAQVRGSKYAWDIRIISADALVKLVDIKEAADDQATINKIRSILTPIELTKLDFVVDLLATTAEDLQEVDSSEEEETGSPEPSEKKFVPVGFNKEVAETVANYWQKDLKKATRTLYAFDKKDSVRCLVSKTHESGDRKGYWYAYHPHFNDVLEKYENSYIAFGCGSPEKVLLFEINEFTAFLPKFNKTEKDGKAYWHVHLAETPDGKMLLHMKGGEAAVDVTKNLI